MTPEQNSFQEAVCQLSLPPKAFECSFHCILISNVFALIKIFVIFIGLKENNYIRLMKTESLFSLCRLMQCTYDKKCEIWHSAVLILILVPKSKRRFQNILTDIIKMRL